MKKYFLLFVVLFSSFATQAQIVEGISITRKELAVRGGQLRVVLEVVVDNDCILPSQSWAILPELSTADRQSVKLFPHILINGRYQQQMMERRQILSGKHWSERKPYKTINLHEEKAVTQRFTYEHTVPYESWMKDASLVLRQVITSPGRKQRVFTTDINGAVDFGR